MRRQTPIAHLLYAYLFPNPTPNDPPSFSAHLAKNLVPEVRIEVANFYGDLNSTEARYPGLNYCYAPHRMRLGRFKHHRRLFEAFDTLALTYGEIQDFCCWEGTKWARERFEKDEGIKVEDTTGNEIGPYVDRRELREAEAHRRRSITKKTDISVMVEPANSTLRHQVPAEHHEEEDEQMSDADSEEEELEAEDEENDESAETETVREPPAEAAAREQHVAELNRRREHAINQRIMAAWEQGQSLPPEIEQYLKEQSERGNLQVGMDLQTFITSQRRSTSSAARRQQTASALVGQAPA